MRSSSSESKSQRLRKRRTLQQLDLLVTNSSKASTAVESAADNTVHDDDIGCDAATSAQLHTIYVAGFETVFGSWLGKHSNPFLFGEQSPADVCPSISQVCQQLDKRIAEEYLLGSASDSSQHTLSEQTSNSMQLAIHAFGARWLSLIDTTADVQIVQRLWRSARRDMLKVINRPSYRSMWTLLLFALTPIPDGVDDTEATDGISGQVCVHAALQQIQTLRARQRSLQFNGAQVTLTAPPTPGINSPQGLATASFITAESIAYWAALTFDTSASLTLSCRPLLSSGLFGYGSESSWRMVRTCRGVFEQSASPCPSDSEMSDDRANQIIAAASAWKLLVWKLIANLKEALRDGHDEPEVRAAFTDVMEAVDQWNATYRDLLSACQKRILFLTQETKLRWYEVVLHYHLSILIGVDMLAATDRQDLLAQFASKRIEAESWVLNCLVFGLNNKYTIVSDGISRTVQLVAIDPYAHHVVAAVKLMQQALDRDFAAAKITTEAYYELVSTLTQALQQLPASSKSVQIARQKTPAQPLYSQTFMGG